MNRRLKACLLFLIGALILLFPQWMIFYNGWFQEQHFVSYKSQMSEVDKTDLIKAIERYNEQLLSQVTLLSDPFSENNLFVHELEIPLKKSEEILGYIEIPKIREIIPIYVGATPTNLNKGISVIERTSLPYGGTNRHSVLAGHRGYGYANFFRNIDELEAGDNFYIHILDEVLAYTIYEKEIIVPTQTEKLAIIPDKDIITLLTCHPYRSNEYRLLVKAERTNIEEVHVKTSTIIDKERETKFLVNEASEIFEAYKNKAFIQYHLLNRIISFIGFLVVMLNSIFIIQLIRKKSEH